jgi:hypothetical protein
LCAAKPVAKEAGQQVVSEAPAEDGKSWLTPLPLDIFENLKPTDITVLDLQDQDNTWVFRNDTPARTTPDSSPKDTPYSTFKNTPTTRQSDISENDNLQINIELKGAEAQDAEMADSEWRPDAWLRLQAGNGHWPPFDPQLSKDIETLGVTLPPMTEDEKMLFNPDMDIDSMNHTISMESILRQYDLN